MTGRKRRGRGELESAVMHVLWAAREPMTAKQILERMDGVPPAHTTVLTALDRLQAKGLVCRVGEALRGVSFAAVGSEAEHASREMLGALTTVNDRGAALLRFAGDLDAEDLEILKSALESRDRKQV